MVQCSARSKRSGEQCRRDAMHGSHLCYMHGGKTPKGIASPNYKHGKYSKAMPERLRERFEASQTDEELLSMRDDIALLDARIEDLLKRVDSGESQRLWQELKDEIKAQKEQMALTGQMSWSGIDALVYAGGKDFMTWNELTTQLDNRRKLILAESKRLETMQQMVTATQAMNLMAAMMEAVRQSVDDREILADIQATFDRLTT